MAQAKGKKIAPPKGEVASASGQSVLSGVKLMPYNPDDLVRSKAKGLKLYQDMAREPYIKAALLQKKTQILNIGWDILPASRDKKDIEIAAFVKWNLDSQLKGSFKRDVYEMLDALDNGFSVSEKVWGVVETGKYAGKVMLENIKSKDPYYFDFETDEFGNLGPSGLVINSSVGAKKNLAVDKFVFFSYLMRYENHYGTSDLRAAYRAFWIKDTAWKLRCVYMERYSGNNLRGKYPKNDAAAKEALLQIFRTWQQETGIAIPDGCEVDVLQIATGSVSEYERSISDCNREMQIGILGQTLTMDVGQGGTGSRALGQVHAGVVDDFVLFLDETLTDDINRQVIRPLVDFNFNTDAYPAWTFKSREGFDGKAFSETIMNLARLKGLNLPIKWVKEKYRIPEPEEGEGIIEELQLGAGFQPQQGGAPQESAPAPEPKPQPEPKPKEPAVKMSEEAQGPYHRALNNFEVFSELPRIDKETTSLIRTAKEASAAVYDDIRDSILSQVEKKGIIENKDYSAIEKVLANVGELKDLLADTMLRSNLMGRADIAKLSGQIEKLSEEYTPDKALSSLARKTGMTRAEFEALVDEAKGSAITVAGLEKITIEKEVKTLLLQTIKNGDDFKAFRFRMNEAFIKYSMPVYGDIGTVGEAVLDHHAETIFRTNVMDAYNRGRKDALSDPVVVETFPAWQYSAILDGRTRDTHAAMDGKIFMADDPIWNRITPPNGYNCRCVLIPVNKFDFTREMLASNGDIPSSFPDPGFG